MSTTTLITADELLAMPTGMGKRYELVEGELREMSPAGWRHGKVTVRLTTRLDAHVEENDLGVVFGAGTGFRLASDPDTVRAPDISFISKQNLPEQEPGDGFWPGAPDLAVEVLSPGDRVGEVDEKTEAWLNAGCAAVWVVNDSSFENRDSGACARRYASRRSSCARLLLLGCRIVSITLATYRSRTMVRKC
jgi:Uma2 family endonuclease